MLNVLVNLSRLLGNHALAYIEGALALLIVSDVLLGHLHREMLKIRSINMSRRLEFRPLDLFLGLIVLLFHVFKMQLIFVLQILQFLAKLLSINNILCSLHIILGSALRRLRRHGRGAKLGLKLERAFPLQFH